MWPSVRKKSQCACYSCFQFQLRVCLYKTSKQAQLFLKGGDGNLIGNISFGLIGHFSTPFLLLNSAQVYRGGIELWTACTQSNAIKYSLQSKVFFISCLSLSPSLSQIILLDDTKFAFIVQFCKRKSCWPYDICRLLCKAREWRNVYLMQIFSEFLERRPLKCVVINVDEDRNWRYDNKILWSYDCRFSARVPFN